jgi:hypothetical protein
MAAATHPQSEEPRCEARQRVLLGGRLVFGQDFTAECTIRDISRTGARLRVASGAAIPDRVTLIDLPHGRAYAGQVVWRWEDELGVSFRAAHDLSGPVPPELHHVRALWIAARFR